MTSYAPPLNVWSVIFRKLPPAVVRPLLPSLRVDHANEKNGPRDEIGTAIARRAGCLADSVAIGESIDCREGGAIDYGGRSTIFFGHEHELRCFGQSRRFGSLYSVGTHEERCHENAVTQEAPVLDLLRVAVVLCTSAIRLLPTLSSGSPSRWQLPRETRVLPVCSIHWNHK